MRVYRVVGETNDYQSLLADEPGIWKTNRLWFDGTPRADSWVSPKVCVEDPCLKVPDIWNLAGCEALAFPPAVAQRLSPILALAGELLPLPVGGETLLLLNILQDVDCLDKERTRWVGEEEGQRYAPKDYVFDPRRVPELSMAKWKSPVVATRSPHPSGCDQTFFGPGRPPFDRASFMRNDSPSVTTKGTQTVIA